MLRYVQGDSELLSETFGNLRVGETCVMLLRCSLHADPTDCIFSTLLHDLEVLLCHVIVALQRQSLKIKHTCQEGPPKL